MSPCSQEAHVYCSNEEKKGQLLSEISRQWAAAEWRKVMFSDDCTFTMVRGISKMMRRPRSASRYDPKFTVKTIKDPGSVMVWGVFSGNLGRAGLYFLIKDVSVKGSICIYILKEHLCTFWKIHSCDHFIPDGAPAHDSKIVTNFLNIPDIHM